MANNFPLPRLSVLMPVFNAKRYLIPAIKSVLSQTYTDFEFVIIDDGSTDRSGKIIENFARMDSRVRYIYKKHSGLINSLNLGIDDCLAPVIARMDADDISLPKRLELQMRYLQDKPKVVAVGSHYQRIDTLGRDIGYIRPSELNTNQILNTLLSGNNILCHPTVMFRKDAVKGVGRYREQSLHSEDLDLWIRLASIGELAVLPEVLLQYRANPYSVSHQNHSKQLEILHRVCSDACEKLNKSVPFINRGWIPLNKSQEVDNFLWRASYGLKNGNKWMAVDYSLRAILKQPNSRKAWTSLWKSFAVGPI